MSNWKKYKLGDISRNISYGYTESASAECVGPKFLRITDIVGKLDWNTVPYCKIDESNHRKYKLEIGDIVIARTGATTGAAEIIKKDIDAVFASYLIRFQIDETIANPFYVAYILKSNHWKNFVSSIIGGSAQPGANAKQFANFEIFIPNIEIQSQIAQILTSFDDKIECLTQMNQTLETIAQAIFKEWCCAPEDIIPKSWTWKKLNDIADVSSSKRIFREEYTTNGIPFYRGKEITQLSNGESISTELYISNERYFEIKEKFGIPQIGDILITSVGTIGSVWLVDNKLPFYFKDGNVTWIKDYKTEVNGAFIYQWLQTKETKEQIKSVTIGSTQQALTISALKELDILIPDKETVLKICSQLENINAKKINNLNQIRTLTQLRDSLLPKLMRGEIIK